jgi:hypothetical protein
MTREVHTKPLSDAGDGAVEATLAMALCCYRVMLATVLSSHAGDVGHSAMSLLRHPSNGAAESCW